VGDTENIPNSPRKLKNSRCIDCTEVSNKITYDSNKDNLTIKENVKDNKTENNNVNDKI